MVLWSKSLKDSVTGIWGIGRTGNKMGNAKTTNRERSSASVVPIGGVSIVPEDAAGPKQAADLQIRNSEPMSSSNVRPFSKRPSDMPTVGPTLLTGSIECSGSIIYDDISAGKQGDDMSAGKQEENRASKSQDRASQSRKASNLSQQLKQNIRNMMKFHPIKSSPITNVLETVSSKTVKKRPSLMSIGTADEDLFESYPDHIILPSLKSNKLDCAVTKFQAFSLFVPEVAPVRRKRGSSGSITNNTNVISGNKSPTARRSLQLDKERDIFWVERSKQISFSNGAYNFVTLAFEGNPSQSFVKSAPASPKTRWLGVVAERQNENADRALIENIISLRKVLVEDQMLEMSENSERMTLLIENTKTKELWVCIELMSAETTLHRDNESDNPLPWFRDWRCPIFLPDNDGGERTPKRNTTILHQVAEGAATSTIVAQHQQKMVSARRERRLSGFSNGGHSTGERRMSDGAAISSTTGRHSLQRRSSFADAERDAFMGRKRLSR